MTASNHVSFDDTSEYVLRFSGARADDGVMSIAELATTLQGWNNVIYAVGHRLLIRELPSSDGAPDARFEVHVRAVRHGSFELVLGVIAAGVLGNAAYDVAKALRGKLWDLVKRARHSYLEAKANSQTIEQAAEQLQQLASYIDGTTNDVSADAIRLVEELDDGFASASFPIGRSATQMDLIDTDTGELITFDEGDRQLCARPFRQEYLHIPVGIATLRRIRLLAVNTRNGWGRFEFERPETPSEQNQQECKILDPKLRKPRDVYTGALNRRTLMDVWVRKVVRTESPALSEYWEIYGDGTAAPGTLF